MALYILPGVWREMKIIIKKWLILLLGFGLGIQAYATPLDPEGFYLNAGGGPTYVPNLEPTEVILVPIPSPGNSNVILMTPINELVNNIGGGATISFGYKYKAVRGEGQFIYNYARYKEFRILGEQNIDDIAPVRTRGNSTLLAGMFNVFLDFNFSNNPRQEFIFVPYIGGGIGVANIQNVPKLEFLPPEGSDEELPGFKRSFSSSSVAYQGIAGFRIYLDSVTSINLDYRYFDASSLGSFKSFQMHAIYLTFTFLLTSDKR
ncbi:MAG: outer membrane beta-barrel protein [Legionellales bacterium]|nr:outer membrane beta-barrel protein [Legionellales bacterium]